MQPATDEKIYDPTRDDVPTPVRINAVDYYISKEGALASKMRSQKVKVLKRDGSVETFGIDTFEIACLLHKEGRDALKIGKAEILSVARSHLGVSTPPATTKSHVPTISDKGAEMAGSAIHNLLLDALRLESSREGGDSQLVSQLKLLITEMGFVGEPKTPAVVPYTLVLSASQLAEIHPTLVKFKPQLEVITSHYQSITIGAK